MLQPASNLLFRTCSHLHVRCHIPPVFVVLTFFLPRSWLSGGSSYFGPLSDTGATVSPWSKGGVTAAQKKNSPRFGW